MLRGTVVETHLVGLLPLKSADPAALARAYAATQELDCACEHSDYLTSVDGSLVEMIYLVGDKNESGYDLESRSVVNDVIVEVLQAILERRIAEPRRSDTYLVARRGGEFR